MSLFGKIFSKKTDPELERLLQKLADASAESNKPQGPQGLPATAAKGAEMRGWLFDLIDEFEAATGKLILLGETAELLDKIDESETEKLIDELGIDKAETTQGADESQLIEWFQKRQGLPESELFLESLLFLAFPTPEKKRQTDKKWPAIVAAYRGKPNTDDILIDKADRLANYIILHLGIATDLYGMIMDASPEKFKGRHEINDELMELVKLEESALWFRMINDIANSCIPRECPSFMGYFEDALGYHLAVQGALPEAIVNIVGTRINEYASYQKFIEEQGEPWGGTVLGAAGKHLMEALGFGPSAIFKTRFDYLFLGTVEDAATLICVLLRGE